MLPDLPRLKSEIQTKLNKYLSREVRARLGGFAESPRHHIRDGNRLRMIRADGTVVDSELQKASGEFSITAEESSRLTLETRLSRLNHIADVMAKQMNAHLYETLNKTIEDAGQVVSAKSKPLDAEAIFEVLEKISMDFDRDDGSPQLKIGLPPELMERAREVLLQIDSDPVLRRRSEELFARKRRDWNDREAARKLVG